MDTLAQDLRFALRSLARRPAFTAAVLLTLGLGIGASTAIFSLLNATILRPLPFAEAERLVYLAGVAGPERDVRGASFPEVADWRVGNRSLEDVAIHDARSMNLRTGDDAIRVNVEMVSASYFDLLGVEPARGRTFLAEEDRTPGTHPVVVLSHGLWRTRFGGDPAIAGKAISLNDAPYTVVGVMREGFGGLSINAELWIPSMMVTAFNPPSIVESRGSRWLGAVGRVRDGVSLEEAQRDLDAVAARLAVDHPASNTDRGVLLQSLTDFYLGTTRTLLEMLFVAVLLFLLIACANVTSLQLVRATARHREIALRIALGAGRTRLVRQLLTEGIVIAVLGGVAGVLLAWWGIEAFRPLIPTGLLPAYAVPTLDPTVMGFALLLSLGCGVIFGLVPALRSSRADLTSSLKEGARSAEGGMGMARRPSLQQALVIGEVAIALVLLIGAGLVTRSFREQLAVDPGMRVDDVYVASVALPPQRYAPAERIAFAERVLAGVQAIPGVQAAAIGSEAPLRNTYSASMLALPANMDDAIRYYRRSVTPGYFDALRIPIVAGRAFEPRDEASTPRVAMISEAGARRLWPNENPVGKLVMLSPTTSVEIIGVAGNARFRDLTTDLSSSEPDLYFALAQQPSTLMEIVVRSPTASALTGQVREVVRSIDPSLPVFAESPMRDLLRQQTAVGRFGTMMLGSFSLIALILAAVGIYGVLSFLVGASSREIAIRMALGARSSSVLSLVVRRGLVLAGAGLLIGLVGASLTSRALASLLFRVGTMDPATFAGVSVTLLMVALMASLIPARKATRIEPQSALKIE